MSELAAGLVLGSRYVLVRLLGQGGNGAVWLATDTITGTPVALKFIEPGLLQEPGAMARLEAQVERLAALEVAGLARPCALERFADHTVLVSDYRSGGDLGQFRGRAFELYAPALLSVADTLAALHERGFVHRDLKCSNVLQDGDGSWWLADPEWLGAAGEITGGLSPYHASPQQWRGAPAATADDRYAFGAMLYELICGHPPFYPELTRDKVLFDPPAPLAPRTPVPDRLRLLTLRLLAKDPEQRPASMAEIRAEIERASAECATVAEPAPLKLTLSPPASGDTGRARVQLRSPWLAAAGIGLVLVALSVFWLLPHYVGRRPQVDTAAAANAAVQATRQQAAGQASLAKVRTAAEAARDRYRQQHARLELRAASRFATRDWHEAMAGAQRATQHYESGDFQAALAAWEAAGRRLTAIEQAAPKALEAALSRSRAALAAGQLEAARQEAALARAIAPQDSRALALAQRAERFGEVLALVDAAAQDEQAGRSAAAMEKYRRALAIDREAPGAQAALGRLAAGASVAAYQQAMSQGFAALAAGRVAAAKSAFQRAEQLRPGAPEPAEALAQLEQGQRASALDALRTRALAAEQAERWDEALAMYIEAQGLERTLAFAREGRARTEPRAELARRMRGMLDRPERVWTPQGRAAAHRALANAEAVTDPGPVLRRERAALAALVAAAETPVRVSLRSDGVTDVVVYRVGRLGAFDARELNLVPGQYTIVGTRNGYRDVRRELLVEPGKAPEPVEVRCEESI